MSEGQVTTRPLARPWIIPVIGVAAGCAAALVYIIFFRQPGLAFTITRDVEYATVSDHVLRLDLYLPTNRDPAPPVILWLHGGGWRYGDKSHVPLRFLASEGYAIVSIDYRLSPTAPFPAQIHDCKAAVRWLKANAARLKIDGSRIVAAGESAGAHLALLLGTTAGEAALDGDIGPHAAESTRLAAVISFFGSADLTAYGRVPGQPATDAETIEVLTLLLGGPLEEKIDLARQASPLHWVSSGDAPTLVLHDKNDAVVPAHQSLKLVEQLKAKNVPVRWHWREGPAETAHNTGPFLDEAGKERIREFLREHVGKRN